MKNKEILNNIRLSIHVCYHFELLHNYRRASQVTLTIKNLPANAGDAGSVPGLGRSSGGGNDNQLQYSCLRNLIDRGSLAGYSPWGHKRLNTT